MNKTTTQSLAPIQRHLSQVLMIMAMVFASSSLFAQLPANSSNIIVFADGGQKFTVYINSVQQNPQADHHVKIYGVIPNTSYRARIDFEADSLGMINEQMLVPAQVEKTYVLVRKPAKYITRKGKRVRVPLKVGESPFKLKVQGQTPMNPIAYQPPPPPVAPTVAPTNPQTGQPGQPNPQTQTGQPGQIGQPTQPGQVERVSNPNQMNSAAAQLPAGTLDAFGRWIPQLPGQVQQMLPQLQQQQYPQHNPQYPQQQLPQQQYPQYQQPSGYYNQLGQWIPVMAAQGLNMGQGLLSFALPGLYAGLNVFFNDGSTGMHPLTWGWPQQQPGWPQQQPGWPQQQPGWPQQQPGWPQQQPTNPVPGYNGPTNCPWPMAADAFQSAKSSIDGRSFESTKLDLAKQIVSSNCFTTSQVRELVGLFDFESSKLELAKYAYGYTYDKANYFKINDVFDFDSSVSDLSSYISGR